MTPEEITKLRELCNGATPGPWEPHKSVLSIGRHRQGSAHGPCHFEGADIKAEADAAFIAAAREAVPKLLDALDAAERERDEARDASAAKSAALKGVMNATSSMAAERDTARASLAELEGRMETRRLAFNLACEQRDTARAQVETLAEALRRLAKGLGHHQYQCSNIARAALKAAELDNTSGESK